MFLPKPYSSALTGGDLETINTKETLLFGLKRSVHEVQLLHSSFRAVRTKERLVFFTVACWDLCRIFYKGSHLNCSVSVCVLQYHETRRAQIWWCQHLRHHAYKTHVHCRTRNMAVGIYGHSSVSRDICCCGFEEGVIRLWYLLSCIWLLPYLSSGTFPSFSYGFSFYRIPLTASVTNLRPITTKKWALPQVYYHWVTSFTLLASGVLFKYDVLSSGNVSLSIEVITVDTRHPYGPEANSYFVHFV